ncbi:hypothetical protein CCR94_09535 [Rhodoblastus sphagnicola]|uniref:Uncharacterized protein n=1 Tax=Rhodoblastus sphagnicola TaxID=333368 RepID=A0A2S6N9R3_9HYPH|nr:hypothetical protein CCR94_09535 [Rhodoblastus sphagnicola]
MLIDTEPLPHLKCCRESVGGEGVMRRISMTTRDELIAATVARYALADRTQRSRILDEFTAVTGFHRKHASRLLRSGKAANRSAPRLSRRI